MIYIPCSYAVWPSNARETLVTLPGLNSHGQPFLFVDSSKVKPINGIKGLLETSLLGFSNESLFVSVNDIANLENEIFLIKLEDLLLK